ncbi:PREDICTED: sporamin B-like [Ipomoea nil]|uniref:sporamin B-like n=1 Tax=Ipomoea nil TaxID=35883 RepID=UPI000901C9B5|nr:PREDICTED: sporamin B-like [Ipomoea nil]
MKSSSEVGVLLLALTVLLSLYHPTHSFTYNPIRLPTDDDAGTAVLDADGDPLKPGTLYKITAPGYGDVILGHAFPVGLQERGSLPGCPTEVLLVSNPEDNVRSVKFIPEDATATSILESTRLAVRFDSPVCVDFSNWHISAGYDPSFVTTTQPSFSYNFMIHKSAKDNHYQLAFCPSDSTMCYTVGTLCTQTGCPLGIAHLAISYLPISVQFLKGN